MNQSNTQKRTYQKPYLVIESLQMVTSIAAGCTSLVVPNVADAYSCPAWIDELRTHAFAVESVCGNDTYQSGNIYQTCLNNPSEAHKLFAS